MRIQCQNGFSLVQVLLVMGLLGGASLVVMNLSSQSTKSTAKYQFDTDVIQITNEINTILADPNKCRATFIPSGTANVTSPVSINGKFNIGNSYGNAGVQIESYLLSVTPYPSNDGVLTITYKNKAILKGTSGREFVTKKINLFVEQNASNLILRCRSLSLSVTDIWSRGGEAKIYYSGGNVGIGTDNPRAALEVTGGIKPGTATTGTSCAPNPEGTFAYDMAAHGPVYCNEAGVWAAAGGSGANEISGNNPACPAGQLAMGKYWLPRNCNNFPVPQGGGPTNTCTTPEGWYSGWAGPSCTMHWSGDNNDGTVQCPANNWTKIKCI